MYLIHNLRMGGGSQCGRIGCYWDTRHNKASRFGNPEFRMFYDKAQELVPSLHTTLANFPEDALPEVSAYLINAWGNRERIDYGSGMELNFLCWLICLKRFGIIDDDDHVTLVIRMFW